MVAVTPENRGLFLDPGVDYIVDLPDTPFTVPGGISIVGGRNVVIRGGEIYDDTPLASGETTDGAYGLYLEDQTGTIHLEGLWIHGRGIGQALILDESKGATVQVQTSRFAALHPVGNDVHTDGIQTWEGPKAAQASERDHQDCRRRDTDAAEHVRVGRDRPLGVLAGQHRADDPRCVRSLERRRKGRVLA